MGLKVVPENLNIECYDHYRAPVSFHTSLSNCNVIYSSCVVPSGRTPETKALGLDKLGVRLNKETGKIVLGADESTSVPNIYAFGDIGEVGFVDTCQTDGRDDADNIRQL